MWSVQIACRWLFLVSCFWLVPYAWADDCAFRLLASGYYSNVHVYDACSGAHLRKLDDTGRIVGAQAVKVGPDGLLWVVSEEAGKILRYRADTLDFVDVFADVGQSFGATGLAFGAAGDVYVSSYDSSVLRRYAVATGQRLGDDVSLGSTRGPDNGMLTGPDGKLYIPGYDTHDIVRYDPASGTVGVLVAPRSNGIVATRGLLVSPDGAKLYVSAERAGLVLRYNLPSGSFDRQIAGGLGIVTGLAWHPDGSLLVARGSGLDSRVVKLDPETGAQRAVLVQPGAGGLSAVTYLAVIPAPAPANPDPATIGSQYWLTGLAALNGATLDMPAYTALNAAFGPAFDPSRVVRLPWGRITMTFRSCTEADFAWQSTGAGTAGFGNGGYRMYRILRNAATAACEAAGMAAAPDKLWIAGAWYGGEGRSGEGLMLDVTANDEVFLAWFTHRPLLPQ